MAAGVRFRLEVVWRTALGHPKRFARRWAAASLVLVLLPFGVLSLKARAFPTYVKGFDLGGWARDVLTLAMPVGERLAYLTEQPLLEAGTADRSRMVRFYYTLSVHNLLTFIVLGALIAVYVTLLQAYLRQRSCRTTLGDRARLYGGLGAFSVAGVSGASVSAAACCGGIVGPAFLSLLGLGVGVSELIAVRYQWGAELVGFGVLLVCVLYLAGRVDGVGSASLVAR